MACGARGGSTEPLPLRIVRLDLGDHPADVLVGKCEGHVKADRRAVCGGRPVEHVGLLLERAANVARTGAAVDADRDRRPRANVYGAPARARAAAAGKHDGAAAVPLGQRPDGAPQPAHTSLAAPPRAARAHGVGRGANARAVLDHEGGIAGAGTSGR